MEERRKYIRIPDSSKISYKLIPASTQGDHLTKDISRGGIKFLAHQFVPKDSLLKLKLTLCKTAATFEAIAKVMWIRQVPHQSNYEVGVQFIDIPQKAVEHLLDYIKISLHCQK